MNGPSNGMILGSIAGVLLVLGIGSLLIRDMPRPVRFAVLGCLLLGVLSGYPLSYFFQSSGFRNNVSMGDYVGSPKDVLGLRKSWEYSRMGTRTMLELHTERDSSPRNTALGVWAGCVVVFPIAAWGLSTFLLISLKASMTPAQSASTAAPGNPTATSAEQPTGPA